MKFPSGLDPWIGRLIGDREQYRLDERLRTGGMADVFLATDTLLGHQVALKLLKDTLVESEELRKRFEWEVALYAALKSDHIVEISDHGITAEGHPFYVMEYQRGQSLKQLLQLQQLSVERTISIITQVCDGLRLAHEGVTLWQDEATKSQQVKVVHRNLKPDNIFLVSTAAGELVKILDFSIAKIDSYSVEKTNLTSKFIGTFRYAAPEQLRVALDLDGRADIYSLGIILYEMLSGTDPFGFGVKARSISEVSWALAHTSKPAIPLRSQPGLSHLSPELEAVVMRCLQKAPDERFASVDELKRALQAAAVVGDGTISQLLTPSEQGSEDTNIPQPATPPQLGVPEATIAQIPPPQLGVPEATIAQIPPPPKLPEATIAQIPPPPKLPEATIAQIPPPQLGVPEATIAQIPPPPKLPEATIAQIPLPPPKVPEATIAQIPPPQLGVPEATIAQIPPPQSGVPAMLQKLFERIVALSRLKKRL